MPKIQNKNNNTIRPITQIKIINITIHDSSSQLNANSSSTNEGWIVECNKRNHSS